MAVCVYILCSFQFTIQSMSFSSNLAILNQQSDFESQEISSLPFLTMKVNPLNVYLFKVNNKNTRKR